MFLAMLMLACAPTDVTEADWRKMSHEDRVLYVNTLIGAEKVKDAKGGDGKTYALPPEDYVKQIEAAYTRGDARTPEQIFLELGR
jgi:hypothetical protein